MEVKVHLRDPPSSAPPDLRAACSRGGAATGWMDIVETGGYIVKIVESVGDMWTKYTTKRATRLEISSAARNLSHLYTPPMAHAPNATKWPLFHRFTRNLPNER